MATINIKISIDGKDVAEQTVQTPPVALAATESDETTEKGWWASLTLDEPEKATEAQRRAIYRCNLLHRDIAKQLTKEQAMDVIALCVKLRSAGIKHQT